MKSNYILFPILGLLAASSMTGCYDMDTAPLDQYITDEQKTQAKEDMPSSAQAGITGITGVFSTFLQVVSTPTDESHIDFGFPGFMLGLDSRNVDMVGPNSGYNWFSPFEALADCSSTDDDTQLIWGNCYRQIFSANAALASIAADTEDPTLQFYRAQALGMRANCYQILAQCYQFTYNEENKSKPCVMIITEKNQQEAAENGIARATVEQVYTQIMEDLDESIRLLTESGLSPEKVLSSKPKRFISLATAYGLRARANLVMKKYAEAAADADMAIQKFNGRPLAAAAAGKPGFSSLDESNWMWGIAIAETDRVVTSGIINLPSHLTPFAEGGYTSVGAVRCINKALYASIPESDVRRAWFLDENQQSVGLNAAQQEYIDAAAKVTPAYTCVKFDSYSGEPGVGPNANDFVLMRIEEMYLIKAEGEAMSGNPGMGAQTLTTFVQTYRDPAYTVSGSAEDIQEACFQQRRVELFGEGLIYFDYMRLNKDFNRLGGGFPSAFVYNVPAGSDVLIYPIPEGEVNGNKSFTSADNNTPAPRPQIIPDTTTPIFAE